HTLGIGAVLQLAHQSLARELEQDPFKDGVGHSAGAYCPTANRVKRRITTFSPVVAVSSSRSCWTVLPSNFGLCISCSSSVTVWYHESSLPLTILSRTFSGLSAASCSYIRVSASRLSAGTSSRLTYCTVGEAAICIATSRANVTKPSFLATKSVLQSTSISTPTFEPAWTYACTVPSVAARSPRSWI